MKCSYTTIYYAHYDTMKKTRRTQVNMGWEDMWCVELYNVCINNSKDRTTSIQHTISTIGQTIFLVLCPSLFSVMPFSERSSSLTSIMSPQPLFKEISVIFLSTLMLYWIHINWNVNLLLTAQRLFLYFSNISLSKSLMLFSVTSSLFCSNSTQHLNYFQ